MGGEGREGPMAKTSPSRAFKRVDIMFGSISREASGSTSGKKNIGSGVWAPLPGLTLHRLLDASRIMLPTVNTRFLKLALQAAKEKSGDVNDSV